MSDQDETERRAQSPASAAGGPAPRILRSEDLFAGQRTIVIQHAGTQYRLLITRNDRLILQK
jgi:hemin uptake protein HemP